MIKRTALNGASLAFTLGTVLYSVVAVETIKTNEMHFFTVQTTLRDDRESLLQTIQSNSFHFIC